MQSSLLSLETMRELRKLSPEERRERLIQFYLLGKIPNRRLLEAHDRTSELLSKGDNGAWRQFSRDHPTTYFREVLNLKPSAKQLQYGLDIITDDQARIHESVLNYKRTLVKACNSGGKTWDLAGLGLWGLDRGFRVLITASTLAQADAGVGAEIKRFRSNAVYGCGGEWSPKEVRGGYSDLHELRTFSVQVGTDEEIAGSAAGRHYERMMFIIDEANSVSPKLLEQVDRVCTGPNDIVLAAMNATPSTCSMRGISEKLDLEGNPMWNVLTIDGENHPNVVFNDPDIIPGAITREFVNDQLAKAGGNRKHFMFAPPVKGEYADVSSDSLIQRAWIERSMARWEADTREDDYRGVALGADVAGKGGDASSVYGVKKWRLFKPMISEAFCNSKQAREDMPALKPGPAWVRGREIEENVDMIKGAACTTEDLRAIAIDKTGIGDSVSGEMRRYRKKLPSYFKHFPDQRLVQRQEEHKPDVVGYNFGAAPEAQPTKQKFRKFKDQLLWGLARALEDNHFDIPPKRVWASWGLPGDVDIEEELLRPVWGVDSTGHIVVADQADSECADDDMRERVKHMSSKSPNELQAIALALYQFKKLTPGHKPITTAKELKAADHEAEMKRERKKYALRHKQTRGGKLPWQIGR